MMEESCPLCGRTLPKNATEAQRHVNQCLDYETETPPPPPPKPSSKGASKPPSPPPQVQAQDQGTPDPAIVNILVEDILESMGRPPIPPDIVAELLMAYDFQPDLVRQELMMTMEGTDGELEAIPADAVPVHDMFSTSRPVTPPLETPTPQDVYLHVYDLAPKNFTSKLGMGIYHSAVVIYGKEFGFGGTPEPIPEGREVPCGIYACTPGKGAEHFKEKLKLGTTMKTRSEIQAILKKMAPDWSVNTYHILKRNCNHFSDAFAREIDPTFRIPSYINRAAKVGNVVIPNAVLKKALTQVKPPEVEPPPSGVTKATPAKSKREGQPKKDVK